MERAHAEVVKSIHGFNYEMPANYKRVNNINIEDVKKLPSTEGVKRLFDTFSDQMRSVKIEYLFYKDWGGDNITFASQDLEIGMINATNIKAYCDQQLKILEDAVKNSHIQFPTLVPTQILKMT